MIYPVAQMVKRLRTTRETWVRSLGWEDLLEKERLPTPVFWPGEFHGLYSPLGLKESDITEQLSHSPQQIPRAWGKYRVQEIYIFQIKNEQADTGESFCFSGGLFPQSSLRVAKAAMRGEGRKRQNRWIDLLPLPSPFLSIPQLC